MAEQGKRVRTKDRGVYALTSTVRKHNGKPDQCFYITYKNGERKVWEKVGWRSEGFSQAAAAGLRLERMHDKKAGKPVAGASRKLTFGVAYREFEAVHIPTLTPKEAYNTKVSLAPIVLAPFGERRMDSITSLELEKFKAELLTKYSKQSVKHILGLIRRVYNKAAAWGLYSGPIPTVALGMPEPDAARLRYLTREEAKSLLEVLSRKSPLWHDIALLALYSGIRPNDIFALRVHQVNLEAGYIDTIESKSGTYTAYFPGNVRSMLASRMGLERNALLFPSPRGGGVLTGVGKPFENAVKECRFNDGVTDRRDMVVFYTLRHTFASWLAQEGVSLDIIAKLMGHKSTAMTQRYAKLSPDSKMTAINKLNSFA